MFKMLQPLIPTWMIITSLIDFREVICLLLENNRVICYEGKSLLIYFKSKFDLEFKNLTIIDTKVPFYITHCI